MSCALRVNAATQVKVKFHLLYREAAKRGWCCAAPSLFAAWSAMPVYLACLSVVASRFCWQQKCILFFAATSRRRHKTKSPSPSRHRCRLRVMRANKNPCRTQFFHCHTPPWSQSRAWSLRVLFYCSRPPSLSGCAGSRCAAPFPLILPRFPSAPSGSLRALMHTAKE